MARPLLPLALLALLAPDCASSSGPRDSVHPSPAVAPTSVLELTVTDSLRGEEIPCKVLVLGMGGTPTPRWGADDQHGQWLDAAHGALGIGRWLLLARGRLTLPVGEATLAPGHYRFTAYRGPEYLPAQLGEATLTPSGGASLHASLQRIAATEGWIAGEFHIHSEPSSDSDVPLDERVLSLAAEGIEVFASTDHERSADFAPALRALGLTQRLHWLRGDEVSTDAWGHIGVYPLPESVVPERDLLAATWTVEQVAERARVLAPGVIVQLNHPLWRAQPIGYWDRAGFEPATGASTVPLYNRFDAVEVFNAHTLDEGEGFAPPDEVLTAWMTTLSLGHRATAMGNTDTHRLAYGPAGWPRTWLRVPDDDPARVTHADITAAILNHNAVLSSGPWLAVSVQNQPPGSTVPAPEGSVTVRITLDAPGFVPVDRVELWVNRALYSSLAVDGPVQGARHQSFTETVRVERDSWLVVRTRAAAGVPSDVAGDYPRPMPSLAVSNPFYLDRDGGGWSPPGLQPALRPASAGR